VIVSKLFQEVKAFGGQFVFLWHNETIGNYGRWNGWDSLLQHTLDIKK